YRSAAAHVRPQIEVYNGIDLFDGYDLADHRRPDVRPNELDAVELSLGRLHVDADNFVDVIALGKPACRARGKLARETGDEYGPPHGTIVLGHDAAHGCV